jgi:chemotaxis protein methyltransferase CheR
MAESTLASWVAEVLLERDVWRRRRRLRSGMPPAREVDQAVLQSIEVALRDDDIDRRSAALDVVVVLGARCAPLMRRALADPDARLRRVAIDALAQMGQATANLLLPCFRDPLVAVRSAAVDAYARAAGSAGAPGLLAVLGEADTPPAAALAALLGLEAAGVACPRALLTRWLEDGVTAAAALRLAGRAGDVKSLVSALSSASPSRRRAAIVGLADGLTPDTVTTELGDARSTVKAALTEKDQAVVQAAVVLLGHLGEVDTLAQVASSLDTSGLVGALHRAVAALTPTQRSLLEQLLAPTADRGEATREVYSALQRSKAGSPREHDDVEVLTRWFEKRLGLALDRTAHARIRSRLQERMAAVGAPTSDAYLELVRNDPREAAAADDALTVHETYFFRERPLLQAFRDEILPALAATGCRRPRVWSAGCSTGEEAWTLAVLLQHAVAHGVIEDFEVWGTDVSVQAISKAREANYGPRSFRAALREEERAAFTWAESGEGLCAQPSPALRARVSFEAGNLLTMASEQRRPFDVIFCRNVLIYLSTTVRAKLIVGFHESLVPGGALVLGHSESLLSADSPFEPWPLARGLAWRRGGA